MPEVVLFKSEEKKSGADAAALFRALADKIEGGRVVLRQGGEAVTLDIPNAVTLEVKAEEETRRDGTGPVKLSLEVELEWIKGQADEAPGGLVLE